ncbi:hypothetical protein SprV_0200653100 [Sparganum proliferum]
MPTKGTAPPLRTDDSTLLTEMGRTLQRRSQPPLYHLRLCHRPSASCGDQHRPRPPALSPRKHQGHATTFHREIARSDAIPAEICNLISPNRPPLQAEKKVFVRILLNRLNHHLEQGLVPESQCSSCRQRGTTDMIFATRQLQEKCQKMRIRLYSALMDLTKAFDTLDREGLWKTTPKFGCP